MIVLLRWKMKEAQPWQYLDASRLAAEWGWTAERIREDVVGFWRSMQDLDPFWSYFRPAVCNPAKLQVGVMDEKTVNPVRSA
jgi:hypothetical protein